MSCRAMHGQLLPAACGSSPLAPCLQARRQRNDRRAEWLRPPGGDGRSGTIRACRDSPWSSLRSRSSSPLSSSSSHCIHPPARPIHPQAWRGELLLLPVVWPLPALAGDGLMDPGECWLTAARSGLRARIGAEDHESEVRKGTAAQFLPDPGECWLTAATFVELKGHGDGRRRRSAGSGRERERN